MSRRSILAASLILALLGAGGGLCAPAYRVAVNPGVILGPVNRGIFSLNNFQKVYAEDNGLVLDSFLRLNPAGTQARIETLFAEMEPENDNGNPDVFDWSRFHPEKMHRFIEEDGGFLSRVKELGLEPVLLLCYNAPWLSPDGKINTPPVSPAEWAEFAAAAVEHYNGRGGSKDYRLNLRYVEIWNAPGDNTPFWTGRRADYVRLFNTVAKRLHRDYPGVQVGGPSYKNPYTLAVEEFAIDAGAQADFYTGILQDRTVKENIDAIKSWAAAIADETGKPPRIMITEADDARLTGPAKYDYLMARQFALLDLGEILLGYHQFCLPVYQEGDKMFGLVFGSGAPLGYNYFPYYAFRSFRGRRVQATVTPEGDGRSAGLLAAASTDGVGQSLVIHYPIERQTAARVTVDLPLVDCAGPRLITVSRVTAAGAQVLAVERAAPGPGHYAFAGELTPGATLLVEVGEDGPAEPVVELTVSENDLLIGGEFTATALAINTGLRPLSGKFFLVGHPSDWEVTPLDTTSFADLPPGARHTVRFAVKALSPTRDAGLYAYLDGTEGGRRVRPHSLPVQVQVAAPVAFRAMPAPLYAAPGKDAVLSLELRNTYTGPVAGTIRLATPWGGAAPVEYSLDRGQGKVYALPLAVPPGTAEGRYEGTIGVEFRGISFSGTVPLVIKEFKERRGVCVDLAPYFNADGFTYDHDRSDTKEFGWFTYPAEEMPTPGRLSILGVEFVFPDVADTKLNCIRTKSQQVTVPKGRYSALAMLTAGQNGEKKVELIAEYADGTTDVLSLRMNDWCLEPKYGDLPVISTTHRHWATGNLVDALPQIKFVELPLDPGKELVRLKLPRETDVYFFAFTLL